MPMTSCDLPHMLCMCPQPQEADVTPSSLPVFHWLPVANTTSLTSCRNSRQGYSIVVDELGRPVVRVENVRTPIIIPRLQVICARGPTSFHLDVAQLNIQSDMSVRHA